MGTLTDIELLSLLREDDNAAFTEIYHRYWRKLLHYALQKTSEYMDAENLVQDVFVSLWNRRGQLELSGELSNYLVVSVKYRVIKLLAKQRSQRLYVEDKLQNADLLDDSTQEYLSFNQLKAELEEIIVTLPEKAQLIYRMNKEQGMSHRQISEELDMSEKAVNASLVRTKKTLRASLNSFLGMYLL
nr:sigma-70 family RNA polymerase sigma factor [Mucilaginibacter sp. dw_454]